MSSPSSPAISSSSSSESDAESSLDEQVAESWGVVTYDDSLEPLATSEEAAAYEASMAREAEEEEQLRARFDREVDISSWCTCSNCSVDFACKLEECICCQEIDRCGEVMGTFNKETSCITSHPGFQDVCLNKYVLEVAAIGLKTRRGKSYTRMFADGQRSEAEFLRSVAYRQFTRLLWDFMGSSRRYPLPCCAYHKIRKEFPSVDGQYHGFEDEDNS